MWAEVDALFLHSALAYTRSKFYEIYRNANISSSSGPWNVSFFAKTAVVLENPAHWEQQLCALSRLPIRFCFVHICSYLILYRRDRSRDAILALLSYVQTLPSASHSSLWGFDVFIDYFPALSRMLQIDLENIQRSTQRRKCVFTLLLRTWNERGKAAERVKGLAAEQRRH